MRIRIFWFFVWAVLTVLVIDFKNSLLLGIYMGFSFALILDCIKEIRKDFKRKDSSSCQ